MLLTFLLMSAVHPISAQARRVTGKGLAADMVGLLLVIAVDASLLVLFVATMIDIGTDLTAMGAAVGASREFMPLR